MTLFRLTLLLFIIITPITPSSTPSDEDLCGCFDIQLMCDPIQRNTEICYYYQLHRISDNDYCLNTINYFVLSSGDNLSECGLSDIDDITLDYAPKCYGLNTQYSSTNINGLQFTIDDKSTSSQSSSTSSESSSKDGRRRRRLGSSEGSGSSTKTSSSEESGSDKSLIDTDFVIFSACFDSSYVDGTRDSGIIEVSQGDYLFTCDVGDILPNFCGATASSQGSGSDSGTESGSGGAHQGIANQEIAHKSSHQIQEATDPKKVNNLAWEISIGVIIFIVLVIIVGIYYHRTLKKREKNRVEEDDVDKFSSAVNNYNIQHLSRLSLSSISEIPKLKDNLTIVDDICDPVTPIPCSAKDAFDAMDGFSQSPFDTMSSPFGICDFVETNQEQQAPDPEIEIPPPTNASPEAIKMQSEINDIYAHIGIRHRETF